MEGVILALPPQCGMHREGGEHTKEIASHGQNHSFGHVLFLCTMFITPICDLPYVGFFLVLLFLADTYDEVHYSTNHHRDKTYLPIDWIFHYAM